MGRTYRKNDRWKKDRHDQNFRKSKKFKDFKSGKTEPKHHPTVSDNTPKPEYDDVNQ